PEPAALLRRGTAGALHQPAGQDGPVRQRQRPRDAGLDRGGRDHHPQRLDAVRSVQELAGVNVTLRPRSGRSERDSIMSPFAMLRVTVVLLAAAPLSAQTPPKIADNSF